MTNAAWSVPSRATLRRSTAPGLLATRARTTPTAVALRAKHLGLYRERTWRDLAALVGRCAAGLQGLGLAAGERVAIMGDACEEWAIIDQAAQAAGAIVYGIYPTASSTELAYQLRDGGATIFVAENQEYVDRLLSLPDLLPALRRIVVVDVTAMFAYDDARLTPYAAIMQALPEDEAALAHLESLAAVLDPGAPAFIVYTSGTTGHPKGALVSHGRHLAGTANIVAHYPTLADGDHRTVVYLPLCHILGRDIAITLPLLSGLIPHYGESVDELAQTFFEVAPTVLFTVPRYLQKFAAQVLVGLNRSGPLKGWAYAQAMRIGRRYVRNCWDGAPNAATTVAYRIARAVVFRPLLNKLGFDQIELVVAGGAALPPDTTALWQIWGVNLCEIYGQTEEGGAIIAGQKGPFPRPGNVGEPAAGVELQLAASGEILVRLEERFEGYWQNAAATAEVIDADGWIHSGDVGDWADPTARSGLKLIDRARDFIVTAGGKTLSPSYIENIVRASPYVAEVIVFGHNRKYLTALVEIDFDTVSDWARANDITYTGFTSLAGNPRVTALLAAEIERANAQLARVETIKQFRILPKALDPEEEGEPVTPTRKVKRTQMYERFRALVEAMYDDSEQNLVAAEVGNVLQH